MSNASTLSSTEWLKDEIKHGITQARVRYVPITLPYVYTGAMDGSDNSDCAT